MPNFVFWRLKRQQHLRYFIRVYFACTGPKWNRVILYMCMCVILVYGEKSSIITNAKQMHT